MKQLLLTFFIILAPILAQPARIFRDLSTGWTRYEAGQPPRPFAFPRTQAAQGPPFRLERIAQLPADGLSGLSFLLPPLGAPSEVKINGVAVGGLRAARPYLAPPARDVLLPLPDGLLHEGDNYIEIAVEGTGFVEPLASSLQGGGALLGDVLVLQAMSDARLRGFQLRRIYQPFNVIAQVLFAVVLLLMSRGSRYGKALVWMSVFFLWAGLAYDLPTALDFFWGVSRTIRVWLLPLFVVAAAALVETSLALLEWSPRAYFRVAVYAVLALQPILRGATFYLRLAVDCVLLVIALRRRRRLAANFRGS